MRYNKGSIKFIVILILLGIVGGWWYLNYSRKGEKLSVEKNQQSQSENEQKNENSIRIEKERLVFLDEKGYEIKTLPLLKTVPGKSWSEVFISKNGKYAALNNVYKYNQKESIEDAEVIVLNWEGEEMWKIKHHFSHFKVSPNGKYLLAIIDASSGNAPVSMMNNTGVIREVPKYDQVWEADFSEDGSFFAVLSPKYESKDRKVQSDLFVLNDKGDELWNKEKVIPLGSENFPSLKITDDNIIIVTDNIEYNNGIPSVFKEYRFDKQGNLL